MALLGRRSGVFHQISGRMGRHTVTGWVLDFGPVNQKRDGDTRCRAIEPQHIARGQRRGASTARCTSVTVHGEL